MFYNCNNLRNLDLSFFITKNVIDIDGIFNGCSNEIINSNIYKDINENNLKSVKGCLEIIDNNFKNFKSV